MSNDHKCPQCGALNRPDAKFCSNCAAPLVAASTASASPPPSPPGGAAGGGFSSASGFGTGPGAGTSRTVRLALDPAQAFAAFQKAGASLGARVSDEIAPNQIRFAVPYKDTWTTIGLSVKLDCEVQITAQAEGGSVAKVTTGLNVGSAVLLFAIYLVVGLFLHGYGVILGAVADIWVYYKLNGDVSEKFAGALVERAVGAPA